MFTWMIHIFPYEPDFKEVFSRTTTWPRALIHANSDRMKLESRKSRLEVRMAKQRMAEQRAKGNNPGPPSS